MTKNKLKAFIYHSAIWETIRRCWMFCGFSPTCLYPLLGYSGTRLAVQLYQSVVVSCICHLTLWMLPHYQGQKCYNRNNLIWRNGLHVIQRAAEAKAGPQRGGSPSLAEPFTHSFHSSLNHRARLCFSSFVFSEELVERQTPSLLSLSLSFASIKLISEVGSQATEMTNILITAWEKETLEEEYSCSYSTHDISAAVILILDPYCFMSLHYKSHIVGHFGCLLMVVKSHL